MAAEQLARDIAARILDPEVCRAAAAGLPDRPTSDPVGCCELAFAGAGVLKHVIAETQSTTIAARMNAQVDAAVARAFGGAHTLETQDHYGPASLGEAAAAALATYQADAFFSKRMAETLGRRLGTAGPVSTRSTKLFSQITRDIVQALSRDKID